MATVPFILAMIVMGAMAVAVVASLGLLLYDLFGESISRRENKRRLREAEDRAYGRINNND